MAMQLDKVREREKKIERKYSEQRFLTFHQMLLCYFINFSPRCCCIFFRSFSSASRVKWFFVLCWKSVIEKVCLDGYIMLFDCVYYVYCFIHDHGWMNQIKTRTTRERNDTQFTGKTCKMQKHLVSIDSWLKNVCDGRECENSEHTHVNDVKTGRLSRESGAQKGVTETSFCCVVHSTVRFIVTLKFLWWTLIDLSTYVYQVNSARFKFHSTDLVSHTDNNMKLDSTDREWRKTAKKRRKKSTEKMKIKCLFIQSRRFGENEYWMSRLQNEHLNDACQNVTNWIARDHRGFFIHRFRFCLNGIGFHFDYRMK